MAKDEGVGDMSGSGKLAGGSIDGFCVVNGLSHLLKGEANESLVNDIL